jgi:hypothetical protein
VRPYHGKSVAEGDDDPRIDARDLGAEDDMFRHRRYAAPRGTVMPVHAKQIPDVRGVRVDFGQVVEPVSQPTDRVGKIRKPRQRHTRFTQVLNIPIVDLRIDNVPFQP